LTNLKLNCSLAWWARPALECLSVVCAVLSVARLERSAEWISDVGVGFIARQGVRVGAE